MLQKGPRTRKNSQFKSMAAIILVLAILFSQFSLVQDQALTLSSATWKPAVPMNGQFDYLTDQQTAAGQPVSQDIVGDSTTPAFYTSYDEANNEIAFRIRLNNQDGNNDTLTAFKNFAFVGIDVANSDGTFDSKLDFLSEFIMWLNHQKTAAALEYTIPIQPN